MLSGKRKGAEEEEAMGIQIELKKPKNESMEESSISAILLLLLDWHNNMWTVSRKQERLPTTKFLSSPNYILKTGGEEAIDVDLEWQDEELLELEEQEHLWQMQHDEAIQAAQAAQAILHYPTVNFSICSWYVYLIGRS